TSFNVDNHDLIAMIRKSHQIVGRRDGEFDGAAKIDLCKRVLIFSSGIEDNQRFVASAIMDRNEALSIAEPFQETITCVILFSIAHDRTFPIAHRECLAACRDGERVPLWMKRDGIPIAVGVHKLAIELCTLAGEGNFDKARFISLWI